MPITPHLPHRGRLIGVAAVAAAAALVLSGCTGSSNSDGKVTITLSGPNQWTSETKTFGAPWDDLVANFEKDNPDIEVKTNVLPLSSWAATSAAQLTAGTAPELIFNQTTHKADQVLALDSYLTQKNPFASEAAWMDEFDPKMFGEAQKDADGHYEWIPFNLVAVGIYYNEDLLKKSGISPSDLTTFSGFTKACTALKNDGVNPIATDNGPLALGWTQTAINSMVLSGLAQKVNAFDDSGAAGTADPVTIKSWVQAVLNGTADLTKSPDAAAAAELLKKWYDACATPNWSGVQSQGSFTGGTGFPAGKAAMAWGTDFSAAGLTDAGFSWGALPFPTISTSDSPYANGNAAQFGISAGGTSYMIPAYITGAKRDAAIKFLQYLSSPKAKDWINATGAIPSITSIDAPSSSAALLTEAWSTPSFVGVGPFGTPAAAAGKNGVDGYLLGSKSLDDFLSEAQEQSVGWANETKTTNNWTDVG